MAPSRAGFRHLLETGMLWRGSRGNHRGIRAMNAQELLQEISDYCRETGLAESTFGRRAVNDGKLASRLRHGGRITTETLDRIRGFMASNRNAAGRPAVIPRTQDQMPARLPETPSTPRPMAQHTTMSPSINPR